MISTPEGLQRVIEAAILVAGRPLSKADILKLFDETSTPPAADIQAAIIAIQERYHRDSGIELREVASGFQFQAKTEYSQWLTRLWEDRPARYSRAFLETLALIAYRQPVTRAEIEDIRGVTVSTNIIKTLTEREWIRVIGYKDVPGKPALYGTTKSFLDDFNLKSLDQLPTLAEIKDLDSQEAKLQVQLELEEQGLTEIENIADTSTPETSDAMQDAESAESEIDSTHTLDTAHDNETSELDIELADATNMTDNDETTDIANLEVTDAETIEILEPDFSANHETTDMEAINTEDSTHHHATQTETEITSESETKTEETITA
jgi:segregation and condensation protein B